MLLFWILKLFQRVAPTFMASFRDSPSHITAGMSALYKRSCPSFRGRSTINRILALVQSDRQDEYCSRDLSLSIFEIENICERICGTSDLSLIISGLQAICGCITSPTIRGVGRTIL
jgi:hypothetical protein